MSHFLVEMQRREGEQDRVAADILEPIGHRVSSGNPFTALEIALNHDLVDAETTEDSLREAENLLHEGGHWGLSFEGGLCCPVCGLKIAGENAVRGFRGECSARGPREPRKPREVNKSRSSLAMAATSENRENRENRER